MWSFIIAITSIAETSKISHKDSLSLSSSAIEITTGNQDNSENKNQSNNLFFVQSLKNSLFFSSEVEVIEEPIKKPDPLAFDLDGNGITTTGVKHGIEFDID
ncbi:MAG: hypothetical protein QM479_16785, partial [Pseudomonadota bacterium]